MQMGEESRVTSLTGHCWWSLFNSAPEQPQIRWGSQPGRCLGTWWPFAGGLLFARPCPQHRADPGTEPGSSPHEACVAGHSLSLLPGVDERLATGLQWAQWQLVQKGNGPGRVSRTILVLFSRDHDQALSKNWVLRKWPLLIVEARVNVSALPWRAALAPRTFKKVVLWWARLWSQKICPYPHLERKRSLQIVKISRWDYPGSYGWALNLMASILRKYTQSRNTQKKEKAVWRWRQRLER